MKHLSIIFLLLLPFLAAGQATEAGKKAALDYIESKSVCIVYARQEGQSVRLMLGNHSGQTIAAVSTVWSVSGKEAIFHTDTRIETGNPFFMSRPVIGSGWVLQSLIVNFGITSRKTYQGKELDAITLPESLRKGAGL